MSIIQQCPHCGNHVEGKRIQSYAKKVTKTGVKSAVNGAASVGAAGTGAAIGSAILPGVGTVIGAGLGLVGSAMFHTAVNDTIDAAADVVTDAEYEFTCPKCGHTWTGQDDDEVTDESAKLLTKLQNIIPLDSSYTDEYPQLAQCFLNIFRKEYCQPNLSYDSAIDEARTERALHKIAALFEDYPSIKKSIFYNWESRKDVSRLGGPINNIKAVVGFCVKVVVNTPDHFEMEEEQLYFFNKYIVPYCRPNTQPSTPVYNAVPNVYLILDTLKKDGITVDSDSYADCLEEMADHDNIYDWSDYILFNEKKQITYPKTTTVATCKKNINRIVCGLIGGPIFVDVAVPGTINPAEQEYLDNIREFLEDDAEITPRERKMLDCIRQKLGISEERAKELEASLAQPQLTEDEQEYIDMYHEYAEKGEVTEKERRRLDKFAVAMGISLERAKEIEKMTPCKDNPHDVRIDNNPHDVRDDKIDKKKVQDIISFCVTNYRREQWKSLKLLLNHYQSENHIENLILNDFEKQVVNFAFKCVGSSGGHGWGLTDICSNCKENDLLKNEKQFIISLVNLKGNHKERQNANRFLKRLDYFPAQYVLGDGTVRNQILDSVGFRGADIRVQVITLLNHIFEFRK